MAPNLDDIALFPLNIFLLPGETTRLHIFEDRYKQLLAECEGGFLPGFGIMFSSPVNSKSYGSFVELEEVLRRYPDGEMDVRLRAISVFAIQKFESKKEGKLYPGGKILKRPLFDAQASANLMLAWSDFMVNSGQSSNDLLSRNDLSIFEIAATLNFTEVEKLELVDLGSSEERESYIINYLRYLEFLYEQEESTHHGLYLN